MKRICLALFVLSALSLVATGCGSDTEEDVLNAPPPPVPEVSVSASSQGQALTVTVEVPENHHAYLDEGDEGVFIPISFDWGQNSSAELTEMPEGTRDEDVEATVLRGKGTFKFASAGDRSGQTLRVRSQICNDESGICYRPAWTEVSL